ncbi:VCBS repeat-containing protein [Variovorax paradoxus]|uniref:VCBS repeat-containing protein n=1 Tax=Variovorax paradoxus TaxID=34073 RepID=A0AAE3Y113_VARPD|nr:VCBS domain-containing protein [Variovorax paradoxus]MDP9964697.1 VCBS repeat-containing protein [Variovorax paradoxus]MDR6427597.1 VCBS repeat-containing protein [Variovorax paradoxus]MDR6454758.1 VCBS repeat-containing protein [Variovorax paradoxus]
MTTITGSNGDDLLTGTAGNDTINSGNGDDCVSGGAGSDSLNGGAGDDTLDGGSGSDQLNGGSGNDTLIYNVSENIAAGTKDVYTGGAGVDTLQLQFTQAQWLEAATQTQIAAYLAHLAAVTNARTGEVSNGSASDFVFSFGSSTLTVQMTEVLKILVDGVEVNPANEAVNARGDTGATTEDGPGIQIHVLQNDLVPDLVKNLTLASAPAHGTATLVQPAMGDPSTWYFQYQPHTADFQHLAAGESATDTFSYQVKDADGGTGLATVTVTITGTNDGPVITAQDLAGAVSEQVAPAGALSDSGVIGFSDLDLSDVHLVSATGTPLGSVLGSLTVVKNGDTTGTGTGGQLTWTYTVDATAVEYLAAGETRVESFTISVNDQHGGTVIRQIDVTITGTNDAPTITTTDAAAAVTEDAAMPTLSDSGTITFDDVDLSDAHSVSVAAGSGNTLGGVLTAGVSDAATGAGDGTVTWSYSVANAATQYLAQGQTVTETFTVTIGDGHGGTVQQQITVTVTGTNDLPVIGGVAGRAVSEDGSTPNLSTSGALTIADVDQGQSNFAAQAHTAGSNGHGSFTLAADGSWTYAADNGQAAIQQLSAGQSISDSFTAVSSDGTASQVVTVTITGTNDVPIIGGVASGATQEDFAVSGGGLAASGALTITDVDAGQSSFTVQASTAGSNGYGSFTLTADGNWTYIADNSQAAIQQLGAGQSINDSFTAVSSDGTASQLVTVTITGTNDVPTIGGVAIGAVNEDGSAPNLSANGALTIADVDAGQSNFAAQAHTAGSNGHGSFTLAADGGWSYTADNSQSAIQQLGAGQSVTDSFTAVSSDGTASQLVTVTITGTNDVPLIAGVATGAVSEDSSAPNLSTGGALTIADVDQGQSNFAPQASTTGGSGYGSFTLAADGTWTYAADNNQSAIQQLGAGQSITDSFTAVSSDGTASQLVTVTITGTNDVPVIGGVASGAASEDASTPNLSTGGALTIADVDAGQSSFTAQVSTAGSHGYGSFTLAANGDWTYAANNGQAAIQQLGAGQTLSDSFTAVSSDGTASRVVTVTITGTNDVPTIGGVASATVQEDVAVSGGSLAASGALTIADVDAGQSNFMPQASTGGSNGYGSFALAADGNWTYTVNNSQTAIQQLAAGQLLSDSFTAVSSDGTASRVVTVTIAGTNDAPVLSAAATPALASVNEDAGAPVGAVGTLVSSLVNLNPPAGGLDNVADADNGAITGIALSGVNASNGSWWYSTNGGASWAAVGAVSDASALLLAADANTRVYFQANSNFNGTVGDGITFHAWDQTSGTAGTTAIAVTNGGSSAFSSATDTASITVNAVNDDPVAATDRVIVSSSTLVTLSASSLLGNDTDIDGLALTITSVSGAVGISGLTLDATNGTISFTSGTAAGSFQYTVSDGAGGTATATATIDVMAVSNGNAADTIDLGAAGTYQASFIDGRGGADNLTGGAAGDVFIGGSGNGADTLLGSSGNDLLIGGDGNDTLSGGAGNDVLRGGLGSNDSMDGGAGSEDLLDFSDGTVAINFTLVQSAASTSIVNGTGGLGNNDTYQNIEGVIGTGLADTLTGSASNDIIRGGAGNDTLDGAGGTGDLLDFSDGTAGLTFTLTQSSSTTSFNASAAGLGTDSYRNFEGVIGTAFADTITGSASNDQLRGGGGNDVINGLAGDDRIVSGAGADILTGGADNDTFVFDSAPNAVDSVTDFDASGSAASGDLIELSRGTFTTLTTASGSTLSAAEFASLNGGGAGDAVGAGVHVIYDSATGNLYYDADGLGAANRTLVATLTLSNPADTFDSNDMRIGL